MKHAFIFLLFALRLQTQAQLPDYYVYLSTGDVTIARPGTKPSAAKQSQLVYKNDVIILKKGAELTLVDKDASFLVLNTAGTYKANELTKKATKRNNDGITGKYLKLLFHELLDPNQDFEKFKKENVAGVWGGVSRSDDCGNRILPMDGFKTSGAFIVFKWRKTTPSSNYSFEIYDHENKPVNKISVKDTVLLLKINETLHNERGIYKWRIVSGDGSCEDEMPIYFEILTSENEKKLIGQLLASMSNETIEKQLQQVDKLEKNGFIDAASSRYAALVKANPEDKALMKSYVAFLLKYGFDGEAKSAWHP
jgi:hypothetical protein